MHFILKPGLILLALCSLSSFTPALPVPAGKAVPAAIDQRLKTRASEMFQMWQAGKYPEAIAAYSEAAKNAEAAGQLVFARKFLNNLGACQLAMFKYRDALNTLEHARALAETSHSPQFLAEINLNISSLFLQLGDVRSAATAAERGMAYIDADPIPGARAKLLIQLASVRASQNHPDAAGSLFAQGIDAAYSSLNPAVAALGLEYLGSGYLAAGRLADADRVLTEAFRVRACFHLSNVNSWQLALVRAQMGELRTARVLIDHAVLALQQPGNVTPPWKVYGARGRIRLLSSDPAGAMSDLRAARGLSHSWKIGLVANDSTRTDAESRLASLFYSSLVQAGNQLYARTKDGALPIETFEAIEENRASSLRALTASGGEWRLRLPARYWELLRRSQAAETRALKAANIPAREAAARLRSELDGLEASAGSPAALDGANPLARVRKGLPENSVLFSFHLGEPASWLWAVTGTRLAVYQLPAKARVVAAIRAFQEDIRRDAPSASRSGADLYAMLFAAVPPALLAPERWLLSLDEDLFNLPFAALVPETDSGRPVYLAERHALQIATGAMMLNGATVSKPFAQSFLGVGDPIYNHADPRWHAPGWHGTHLPDNFFAVFGVTAHANSTPSFARLSGSGEEIRAASEIWRGGRNVLLTGAQANKARLWREFQAQPSIVHFATHIMEASTVSNTGWIALTLDSGGQPEFIGPAEISARAVPARLVVLSGCSSGSAQIRGASGLMGLTRAFMAAGAGSVLATRWPTLDDRGTFLTDFYRHLHDAPAAGPSAALRSAQREAMKARDWRAQPSFWSSYFLMEN